MDLVAVLWNMRGIKESGHFKTALACCQQCQIKQILKIGGSSPVFEFFLHLGTVR